MSARRVLSMTVACCCAFTALLAVGVGSALAVSVEEQFVTDVSATGATLQAKIAPEEVATTYRFEYDTSVYSSDAAHGTSVPSPEGDAGAGELPIGVSVHVQGLTPDTEYHFRVVASNSEGEVVYGKDEVFTTQSSGGEFGLPDGRVWELVTPPDKHGAVVEPIPKEGGLIQAAEGGGAITYITQGSVMAAPEGNRAAEYSQELSVRGSDGWSTQDIDPENNEVSELVVGQLAQYRMFSPELSLGLFMSIRGDTQLSPEQDGEAPKRTMYLRADPPLSPSVGEQEDYDRASHDGELAKGAGFLPLLMRSDVPEGVEFGQAGGGVKFEFEGATPDLRHVIFQGSEALAGNAAPGYENLYEWSEGKLQLVSELPSGKAASEEGHPARFGLKNNSTRNAVASNGSRVIWEVPLTNSLYMTDVDTDETVELNAPREGAPGGGGEVQFQVANSNDSRVFFTSEQKLTPNSHLGQFVDGPNLYVFEDAPDEPLSSGTLTDITADTEGGEEAQVKGLVMGVSEDGSDVYFAATAVLGQAGKEGAVESRKCRSEGGTCNLYIAHYNGSSWETKFIVLLSNEEHKSDDPDWDGVDTPSDSLRDLTSRVSPDGRYLVFMSERSLTGYDNHDAVSGEADEEVYLYDADTGRLRCVSCNPTGARPHGVHLSSEGLVAERVGVWGPRSDTWFAGSVPGWTPIEDYKSLYQSRYLSDNGRVFFNSPDSLVPADVDGLENVYEFEPEGVGGCSGSSGGASVVYSRSLEGCIGLISSGTSSEESAFLDASAKGGSNGEGAEGGGDVFFMTTSKLVPEDVDSAYDVYDAHECIGGACGAPSTVSSPACTTADSCREAPLPQPSIFGAPSSATFVGSGDVSSLISKPVVKSKGVTREERLKAALRVCKRKRGRARDVCEVGARRRFGAKASRVGGLAGRGK